MATTTVLLMFLGAMGFLVPFAVGQFADPIVIGGTTTVIGGTTTVIGGTTTVIGGTTTLVGAITTAVDDVTIVTPGAVVTTTIPGKPALVLAKSTACATSLKLRGPNSRFVGGVVSNGGVSVVGGGISGDLMQYGNGIPPSCVQADPAVWGGVIEEAPEIYDWFVPMPGCIPTSACQPGSSTVATSISDGTTI